MDPPLPPPYPAPFPLVWQPPPLSSSTCNVQTAPAFNTPLSVSQNDSVFRLNQPPLVLPPMFDASRPPPPLPRQPNNGATKRRLDDKAGPNKLRKPDEPKADKPCNQCVQKNIRIDIFKQQIQKLKCDEEYQLVLYKMRLQEYENEKEVLKSFVGSEFFKILEDYIEGEQPRAHGLLEELTQDNIVSDGSTTLPEQLLLDLIEYMLNNWRASVSSSSKLLSSRTGSHGLSSSSEVIQTVPSILHTLERSQSTKSLLNETQNIGETRTRSLAINGFNNFGNEQRQVERFTATSTANPVRSLNAATNYQGAGMSGSRVLESSTPQTPTAKQYLYSSGVGPQSNEQYYSLQYNPFPLNTSVPFNIRAQFNTFRAPQFPITPSTSSAASKVQDNANTYNQYAVGSYQQPTHCYPSYQ